MLMITQIYLRTKNWTFLKTRDDNFEFLKEKLPKKFDFDLFGLYS